MDNQHQKIKGYRDLTQEEIDLINDIKSAGDDFGQIIKLMGSLEAVDQHWVDKARDHLQIGIMLAVRAVAKPDGF